MKTSDYNTIIERVYEATGIDSQTELARVLKINRSAVTQARKKGQVPDRWLLQLYRKFGLNPEWLEKGAGRTFLGTASHDSVAQFEKIPKVTARLCAGDGSFDDLQCGPGGHAAGLREAQGLGDQHGAGRGHEVVDDLGRHSVPDRSAVDDRGTHRFEGRQHRRLVLGGGPEHEGEVLLHLNDEARSALIEKMDAEALVAATETLDTDDLADILPEMPQNVIQELLLTMEYQDRERLRSVLAYAEDSAGGRPHDGSIK